MAGSLCSGESLAFIKNFYENLSFTVFVQYKKGQQEGGDLPPPTQLRIGLTVFSNIFHRHVDFSATFFISGQTK